MERGASMAALGKLKTSEMKQVFELFYAKIKEMTEINPTKGGS
jgi:hypothetical protein